MKFQKLLVIYLFLSVWTLPAVQAQNPCDLDNRFDKILDSMLNVLNVKSLSASVILPDSSIWAGAAGISSTSESASPDHKYCIGSITKTLTSACVLQLVDAGTLTLNDSVGKWLPPYQHVNSKITIRQLLRHQSGLYDVITNPDYNTNTQANIDSVWTFENLLKDYIKAPLAQPGATWSYCNTNYVLLAMIIKAAVGEDYHKELEKRFFTPLNLTSFTQPAYEPLNDPIAHVWLQTSATTVQDFHDFFINWRSFFTSAGPSGGYFATATDVSRWTRSFINGDLHTAATMTQAKMTVPGAGMPGGTRYGLGLMERKYQGITGFGHGGDIGYSGNSIHFPAKQLTISVLNNDARKNSWDLAPVILALMKGYLACEAVSATDEPISNGIFAAQVSPNPFSDGFTCNFELTQAISSGRWVVTDAVGHTVAATPAQAWSVGAQRVSLDNLGRLPAGFYFATFQAEGSNWITKKLFK